MIYSQPCEAVCTTQEEARTSTRLSLSASMRRCENAWPLSRAAADMPVSAWRPCSGECIWFDAPYNLCWVHQQLGRTPAMAAGLTDHAWSVKEVLCYEVAPAPFAPSKRSRGRPRTQPQGVGPLVKASQGRPSRYLSILRRLQEEKRATLIQQASSATS